MKDKKEPLNNIACLSINDVLSCCYNDTTLNLEKLYELVKSKTGV